MALLGARATQEMQPSCRAAWQQTFHARVLAELQQLCAIRCLRIRSAKGVPCHLLSTGQRGCARDACAVGSLHAGGFQSTGQRGCARGESS